MLHKLNMGLKIQHTFNTLILKQREKKVEDQFIHAFNKDDLKMKGALLKDNGIRR